MCNPIWIVHEIHEWWFVDIPRSQGLICLDILYEILEPRLCSSRCCSLTTPWDLQPFVLLANSALVWQKTYNEIPHIWMQNSCIKTVVIYSNDMFCCELSTEQSQWHPVTLFPRIGAWSPVASFIWPWQRWNCERRTCRFATWTDLNPVMCWTFGSFGTCDVLDSKSKKKKTRIIKNVQEP